MGAVRRKGDGPPYILPQPCVIGRAAGCELRLSVSSVSAQHAAIRWNGAQWGIVDLGSRNGTFVNGHRLSSTSRHLQVLQRGDELTFAEADETWVLIDDGPPTAMLGFEGTAESIALNENGVVAFPDEANPQAYIYFERGLWRIEDTKGNVRALQHGEALRVGDQVCRVYLPDLAAQTASATKPVLELSLGKLWIEILVASNEETASVRVRLGNETIVLPARTHLYLMAYLGRLRLAARDADPALERVDGGWIAVADACRQLTLDPDGLGVMVYRCRKDFERAGFPEASRIIDREKRGYLRIGVPAARLLITQEI